MNLKNDMRQEYPGKTGLLLRSRRVKPGGAGGEATESSSAAHEPENPANTNRLMEEVCERENLKEALRRVKTNKGSSGNRRNDGRGTLTI